jgi:hypothetical protein
MAFALVRKNVDLVSGRGNDPCAREVTRFCRGREAVAEIAGAISLFDDRLHAEYAFALRPSVSR